MLLSEIQVLLKRYDVEKGRFRKAAGYIPVVGAYLSQTATIKKIREIKYTTDNDYWLKLFDILAQYQKPERPRKTTDIVDAVQVILNNNTPWQNANELFVQSVKRLRDSEILNPTTFSRLCELSEHAENLSAGLECLENGSEQQRQEENLSTQDNLLDENNFLLLCVVATYARQFAIGMHYLSLAGLAYQRPVDLIMKPDVIASADKLARLLYILEKNQQLDDEFLQELLQNPAQAYTMALERSNNLPVKAENRVASVIPEAVAEEAIQQTAEAAVATQATEQQTSLEEALQKFGRLKLETEIDPEILRKNPHHANAMVECFSELNAKGILGKESLECLLKKPSSVKITTQILCSLHRVKALKDNRKKLKAHINAVQLISEIIALMDIQENGFNKATADVLFKHLGEIKDYPKQFKAQLEAIAKTNHLSETSLNQLIQALPNLTKAASFKGNPHTLYQSSASNTLTKPVASDAPAATPKLGNG